MGFGAAVIIAIQRYLGWKLLPNGLAFACLFTCEMPVLCNEFGSFWSSEGPIAFLKYYFLKSYLIKRISC